MLQHKVDQGLLCGVKVCPNALSIHHLLFMDDSLLFGMATMEECAHIQSVLLDYERASSKLLSGDGMELLIRMVVQSLSSYAMSYFLFPKSLCDSLHQMCAKFW